MLRVVNEFYPFAFQKQALKSDRVSARPLQVPPASPFYHGLNVKWILIISLMAFLSRQLLFPRLFV
jgi:hypothetical protein